MPQRLPSSLSVEEALVALVIGALILLRLRHVLFLTNDQDWAAYSRRLRTVGFAALLLVTLFLIVVVAFVFITPIIFPNAFGPR